jgi:hypothetical protein
MARELVIVLAVHRQRQLGDRQVGGVLAKNVVEDR